MKIDERDKLILSEIVRDYSARDLMKTLADICAERADQLIGLGIHDRAKDFSLAAWHLDIFVGETKEE